jgi:predicted lipoprotein
LAAALCGLLALPAASNAANRPDHSKVNARVIETYVLPGFERLADASARLKKDLQSVCAGDAPALADAKQAFEATALAWAGVEFLRFGPMAQIGRPERFNFWPDPRNVTVRQVNALLSKRDATALDPATLIKKSAAVQGLTALEMLLFDDKRSLADDSDAGKFRCDYAVAIAATMHAEAVKVIDEWKGPEGWRRRMVEPRTGETPYASPEAAAGDFARALLTGLQMIQDRQVVPMIDAIAHPTRPVRLPFTRSALSDRYFAAGIASTKALYEALGLGRGIPRDKAWMSEWIPSAFNRLSRDGPAAIKGLGRRQDDADRERNLRMVRFHVQNIRMLVGRGLAPLAGLAIGFNELDGD